ncbi:putative conserved hypothetical protein [Colletotrichum sublineola]|uniref:Uncharacterized protein n=1 Tax=Colletotrichum sublineola TaxID=1173701 RepID=A0A066XR61_COLSU|nr:putative conserved hypothetical protein [Colletotrichum sublineola]
MPPQLTYSNPYLERRSRSRRDQDGSLDDLLLTPPPEAEDWGPGAVNNRELSSEKGPFPYRPFGHANTIAQLPSTTSYHPLPELSSAPASDLDYMEELLSNGIREQYQSADHHQGHPLSFSSTPSSTVPRFATTPTCPIDYFNLPVVPNDKQLATQDMLSSTAPIFESGDFGPHNSIDAIDTSHLQDLHPNMQSSDFCLGLSSGTNTPQACRFTETDSWGNLSSDSLVQEADAHSATSQSTQVPLPPSPLLPLLHVAVRSRNRRVAATLLKHGSAAVDERDEHDSTALHVAAELGDEALVTLLLQHNANTRICNERGHNALYVAVAAGHNEIVELLLEYDRMPR